MRGANLAVPPFVHDTSALGARAGGGRGAALLGDRGAVGQPSDGGEAGGERGERADAAQRGERRHLLERGGRERAARLGRCREMW